jgi:3-deoxy-D-manno-octulosonic acid kinase
MAEPEGTPCPTDAHRVPSGFEVLKWPARTRGWRRVLGGLVGAGGTTVILKSCFRDQLIQAGIQAPDVAGTGPLVMGHVVGGRTPHAIIKVGDDLCVLKTYRRGGLIGHWNSSRYWGSSRFLRELLVAAHAECSSVPTAEVLALVLERAGFGSMRAWLLTRYLPGARPLHEFFGEPLEARIFQAAGSVVRSMHGAGINHQDLHLGNIVGSWVSGQARAHIVDWDRARREPIGNWQPYANLIRLWRSVEKGRHFGGFERQGGARGARPATDARPLRAFIRGYFRGRAVDLAEARKYFRRRALLLGMRSLFWRTPSHRPDPGIGAGHRENR